MSDIVTPEIRSRMMSGIRGKNTKPELQIRKQLHSRGFRYVIHDERLPGKPDLVFPKYRAVMMINGCFWHGHDCHLFKWPSTRREFWQNKIMGNKKRDEESLSHLEGLGWRVLTIWECSIKGKQRLSSDEVTKATVKWLRSDDGHSQIHGKTGSVS